ncbi:MAG: hypothetical protein LBP58_09750 [Azoarcus sp.]|jgi:hypothetical protein|nr:hypothetical protein [Azoarcus sp.]
MMPLRVEEKKPLLLALPHKNCIWGHYTGAIRHFAARRFGMPSLSGIYPMMA